MSRILLVVNPKSGIKSNKNILNLIISEFENRNIEFMCGINGIIFKNSSTDIKKILEMNHPSETKEPRS